MSRRLRQEECGKRLRLSFWPTRPLFANSFRIQSTSFVVIVETLCGPIFVFDTGQHCILVLKNLAQEDKFASKVGRDLQ